MSEIAGQTGRTAAATAIVHESYSFACMRCGHGWEQSYEIEHHRDAEGSEFVTYVADGRVVPSPLSRPSCLNCDSHVVRIMRPGQVSSALKSLHQPRQGSAGHKPEEAGGASEGGEQHHWHLSDLLHPFHHRKAG
ncbi:hypothetical protein AB5J56_26380 [Streptomyces sp. R21]|uniref:C2H2-type domain-containing protein n=1 Tax=Streptomyces sp. R21 TaxID=3238627 RepID=A0AB39PE11_9ACTN